MRGLNGKNLTQSSLVELSTRPQRQRRIHTVVTPVEEDKKINNGTELFGPATGDGFEELAGYDSDGNNWIDDNDPIYDKLRIWMKTADGQDQLFALGEKGAGAIYLNHITTPFAVKDSNNELLGQVRTQWNFSRGRRRCRDNSAD